MIEGEVHSFLEVQHNGIWLHFADSPMREVLAPLFVERVCSNPKFEWRICARINFETQSVTLFGQERRGY